MLHTMNLFSVSVSLNQCPMPMMILSEKHTRTNVKIIISKHHHFYAFEKLYFFLHFSFIKCSKYFIVIIFDNVLNKADIINHIEISMKYIEILF